jgi:hypothetical protein
VHKRNPIVGLGGLSSPGTGTQSGRDLFPSGALSGRGISNCNRENRFRKISGHRDLWALATILRRNTKTEISQEKVA